MIAIAQGFESPGTKRTSSEDVFRIHPELGLYVVCDGSRGEDGRWAAEEICQTLHDRIAAFRSEIEAYQAAPDRASRLQIENHLAEAIQTAAARIHLASVTQKSRQVTSSALAVALWVGDALIWSHIGNARIYLMRAGRVHRLSRDHTYYEEMKQALPQGAAVNPLFKKRLTRAIGDSSRVPVEVRAMTLMKGDAVLLCSNGLSDTFTSEAREFSELAQNSPFEHWGEQLLRGAIERGAEDNLAFVMLQIRDAPTAVKRAGAMVAPEKQVALLRSIELLSRIHDDEPALLQVQSLLTFRQVPSGRLIVEHGAPSDEIFVLLEGEAEVALNGNVIACRGRHEVIGEMGFFTREPRSATVRARSACELMSIHRRDFDQLVERDHRLGYAILDGVVRALSSKLRERLDA